MKKIIISILSLVLIVSSFAFLTPNASAAKNEDATTPTTSGEFTFEEILALEEYISVNPKGLFIFNSNKAIKDGFAVELVEGQQRYLDSLNLEVKEGKIKVHKNLEVEDLTVSNNTLTNGGITLLASCGGVTRAAETHWWGKSRKFNSCDAAKFAADLATQASASAGAALLAVWIPGMGWAGGIAAAYTGTLSARISANNSHGTGVIVNVTWALVFDVEPQ